jgi:hypothetical protein
VFKAARTKAIAHGVSHIPGLRRLPIFKLLAIGEIALLARSHIARLEPAERRRFISLMRKGRGRKENLTEPEREELSDLIAKVEPRLFAGLVADRLSPVPLPRRVVRGKQKRAA